MDVKTSGGKFKGRKERKVKINSICSFLPLIRRRNNNDYCQKKN